ncbi:MAG TPA: aspartyl protease family protein [Pyrinomonadaceae bacterium]|nr:aspartyl protease family protein [Pyrinomonadaceae bacterium]
MGHKIASLFILLILVGGAPALLGASPIPFSTSPKSIKKSSVVRDVPRTVAFREEKHRGLLVKVWINDAGPFTFAIDTGAGISLISTHAASLASVSRLGTSTAVGGLSGAAAAKGLNATLRTVAIGERNNWLNKNQSAIIIDNLPGDIDGVLDPTAAYLPFGYSIDLPNHVLTAFDPNTRPLNINDTPDGGTVVRWIDRGAGRRPFVRLNDGRLALLDTGSGFGLAISRSQTSSKYRGQPGVHDLGGGQVVSERVAPTTIGIGALTLQKIPTDLLSGVEKDAPILLGRDALYPFRLTFDPVQRLIEIAPSDGDR